MKKNRIFAFIAVLVLLLSIVYLANVSSIQGQDESSTFSDDFGTDSNTWQYFGSAYRDAANQNLVLNPVSNQQAGVAYFKAPIQGAFTASFRYKSSGGYQGDGFTMFFYKQKYTALGSDYSGCNLGFNSFIDIPGYGIEFDGWQNIPWDFQRVAGTLANQLGDPSGNHIALIQGYTGNHLASIDEQEDADDNWHTVLVNIQGSSVSVSVDQKVVLQWSGTMNRTYSGFGFSGASGGVGSNSHVIDDFSITAHNLKTPTLATNYTSVQSQLGFNVFIINGSLTFNTAGIADAPIYLSYSVTGGESWQDLTLLNTDSFGNYQAVWLPTVTGNYLLKAVFQGNDNYLGASNIINFTVTASTDFSILESISNSESTQVSSNSIKDSYSTAILVLLTVIAASVIVTCTFVIKRNFQFKTLDGAA